MVFPVDLKTHLAEGVTTTCQAWAIARRDGEVFGFTDHDLDLEFDGMVFSANTGLTARALTQTTGLSVDNSEALGALTSAAVQEEDIISGRFDGAEVRNWLVNWQDPAARVLQFCGTIGELTRGNGTFQAELRGQTEALNQPQGRVYQTQCPAILGDGKCQFDLDVPGYAVEVALETIEDGRILRFADLSAFAAFDHRWFERGRFVVLDGAAAGMIALVKNDRLTDDHREVELWDSIQAELAPGDRVRLEAGCDKRAVTCRFKFNNFLNFRGFPHMPGEDWLLAHPKQADPNSGGSLTGGGFGGSGGNGAPGFGGP